MKKKIKKSDFTEETFWAVKCPSCGEMIEVVEDPTSIWCESAECEMCGETFEVVE